MKNVPNGSTDLIHEAIRPLLFVAIRASRHRVQILDSVLKHKSPQPIPPIISVAVSGLLTPKEGKGRRRKKDDHRRMSCYMRAAPCISFQCRPNHERR